MRSVTNGLAEGLSFNLPKSWARIPERTELCNEENQAIAATLIARFQNPASHRFVLLGWGWGLGGWLGAKVDLPKLWGFGCLEFA